MAFKVYVFVQGKGWRPINEYTDHKGVVASKNDALDLGASTIIERVEGCGDAYGRSEGDLVGFRVEETNEQPEYYQKKDVWMRFSHRFFKRGEAYMLYKTWSWPD